MSEKNDVFDTAEPLHSPAPSSEERIVMPESEKSMPRRRGRPPGVRAKRKLRTPREPVETCPAPFNDEPEPYVDDEPEQEDVEVDVESNEEKPLRRFWKPKRSLPSVEWDQNAGTPDAKTGKPQGAARFEFRRGVFETYDQKLAEELIRRGYLEIPKGVIPPLGPPTDDLPSPEQLGLPQQITAREVFAQAKAMAQRRAMGME